MHPRELLIGPYQQGQPLAPLYLTHHTPVVRELLLVDIKSTKIKEVKIFILTIKINYYYYDAQRTRSGRASPKQVLLLAKHDSTRS